MPQPRVPPYPNVIPGSQQRQGAVVGGMWVILQAWPSSNWYAVGMLGPDGAKLTGGFGDWQTIERPKQVSLVEWKGRKPYEQTIDLLIDGMPQHPIMPALRGGGPTPRPITKPPTNLSRPRTSGGMYEVNANGVSFANRPMHIEPFIRWIEEMARPWPGKPEPPSLRLYGAVRHPEVRWVIQSIDWGENITDSNTGNRLRQQLTLHLIEFTYAPSPLQRLGR